MDYPNGFDIPVNPAARGLAFSRTMAIWTMVALLGIVFLCVFAVWTFHSNKIKPFLISVDENAAEWSTVSENKNANKYPAWRLMQESVAVKFTKSWLNISNDAIENDDNWCQCNRAKCDDDNIAKTCHICCMSGADTFANFTSKILPEYKERAELGETRVIVPSSIVAKPMPNVSEDGGIWKIYAVLESADYGPIDIEAYVKIVQNKNGTNSSTLGYYVMDFNAFATTMEQTN